MATSRGLLRRVLLLLAVATTTALVVSGCAFAALLPLADSPSSSSGSPNALPAGSINMPNFIGQTAGSANQQLRAALGNSITVMAPGGADAENDVVTSQVPAAGTPVNASTSFSFYTLVTPAGPRTTAVSGPSTEVGQGTHVVGTDIPAGTWRTTGATAQGETFCAWWRLKDTTGDVSAIITGSVAMGPTTITVKPSDGAVQLQGGCLWSRSG